MPRAPPSSYRRPPGDAFLFLSLGSTPDFLQLPLYINRLVRSLADTVEKARPSIRVRVLEGAQITKSAVRNEIIQSKERKEFLHVVVVGHVRYDPSSLQDAFLAIGSAECDEQPRQSAGLLPRRRSELVGMLSAHGTPNPEESSDDRLWIGADVLSCRDFEGALVLDCFVRPCIGVCRGDATCAVVTPRTSCPIGFVLWSYVAHFVSSGRFSDFSELYSKQLTINMTSRQMDIDGMWSSDQATGNVSLAPLELLASPQEVYVAKPLLLSDGAVPADPIFVKLAASYLELPTTKWKSLSNGIITALGNTVKSAKIKECALGCGLVLVSNAENGAALVRQLKFIRAIDGVELAEAYEVQKVPSKNVCWRPLFNGDVQPPTTQPTPSPFAPLQIGTSTNATQQAADKAMFFDVENRRPHNT